MNKGIGIVLKLAILVAFLGGLCGGGYLAYTSVADGAEEWNMFAAGVSVILVALFVIGILAPWIAHFDGIAKWEKDEGSITVTGSIKAGLMALYFAGSILFLFIGIVFWLQRGLWIVGIAAIAWFIVMIAVAICISVLHQTRHSRAIAKDKNAEERIGTVISKSGVSGFGIMGKRKFFINAYVVEADGNRYKATLARVCKLNKYIVEGCSVKIKVLPSDMRNCAIVERI